MVALSIRVGDEGVRVSEDFRVRFEDRVFLLFFRVVHGRRFHFLCSKNIRKDG